MSKILSIAVLLIQICCASSAPPTTSEYFQIKPERALFKKSSVEIKSPTTHISREKESGKEYDPRPRVVTVDEKAGKYEFQWIGYDGKKKVVEYQRSDAIDGLVEARVERGPDDKYKYIYHIRVLPSSPSYLGSFAVQTLTDDIHNKYVKTNDENLHIGHFIQAIERFSVGVWRNFAHLGETEPLIGPGSEIEFSLPSVSPPGIVGCAVHGGPSTLKGVGEDMPSELERAIPGYEEMASCLTIGPVQSLIELPTADRAKYILDNLPKFVEAGWMAGDTPKIYETILKRNDLSGAFEQAKKDLEKGFITTEVFHIIEGLNK